MKSPVRVEGRGLYGGRMRYLSACAIFKDESYYLREWLAFHEMVGFEYYYLYDNGSTDDFMPAIQAALPKGNYEVISWPLRPGQFPAYEDCLKRARDNTRWLAFFDIDEFMFSPVATDLRPLLRDYEVSPGLVVNCAIFGSSGIEETPDAYVTQAYRRRCHFGLKAMAGYFLKHPDLDKASLSSYYPLCGQYKSIVDPKRAVGCQSAHAFTYSEGAAVNELGQRVEEKIANEVNVSRFRFNHYWSRSLADLRRKAARGRADLGGYDSLESYLKFEAQLNAMEDNSILPLADRLAPRGCGPMA